MMTAGVEGTQGGAPAPPPPAQVDLLGGLMDDEPAQAAAPPGGGVPPPGMGGLGGLEDIFGGASLGAPPPMSTPQHKVTLPSDRGEGMQIRSEFVKKNGQPHLEITIENGTPGPLSGFAIQFNKSSYGFNSESPTALSQVLPPQIAPGQSGSGALPLLTNGQLTDSKGAVQMAIKTNVKVHYFQDTADVTVFLAADGKMDQKTFLEQWKGNSNEARTDVAGLPPQAEAVEAVCPKFEAQSIFFVARRKTPDGADMVYLSCKTANGVFMLIEIGFRPGTGACSVVIKAAQPQYVGLLGTAVEKLLKS